MLTAHHPRSVAVIVRWEELDADYAAGIESYNEGLDPVKSFVRWERELPQLIRKLRNQHVHYAQTLRILLEPITTDVELDEMLSNPRGSLWNKEMADRLKDRLQDSYFAYQSTIADIEKITKKIASKLDLDRAAEVGTPGRFFLAYA